MPSYPAHLLRCHLAERATGNEGGEVLRDGDPPPLPRPSVAHLYPSIFGALGVDWAYFWEKGREAATWIVALQSIDEKGGGQVLLPGSVSIRRRGTRLDRASTNRRARGEHPYPPPIGTDSHFAQRPPGDAYAVFAGSTDSWQTTGSLTL